MEISPMKVGKVGLESRAGRYGARYVPRRAIKSAARHMTGQSASPGPEHSQITWTLALAAKARFPAILTVLEN